MDKKCITGMGAALVDLFAPVSEAQLETLGSPKASMSLIEATQSEDLQKQVNIEQRLPGGSIANSIAGMALLGAPTGFIGKIGDDALGQCFADAFRAANVRFPAIPMNTQPTGHCLVLVTPDAERTMHTVLGASVTTSIDDLDDGLISDTGILFGEGYLWDSPSARAAFIAAAERVKANGGKIAFSLADRFCVERHHDEFAAILASHIDILLANESEITALLGTDQPAGISAGLAPHDILAAVTYGAEGAYIFNGDHRAHIAAQNLAPAQIIDLTGAGDQFAAGFLAGLHDGKSAEQAAMMGIDAASAVIQHFGPRPLQD